MEMFIMTVIVFFAAVLIKRKEAFALRWQPVTGTWVAVGTGMAAFVFSASLLLFDGESAGARIIHYVLIYVLCGFIVPWGYTLLVERGTVADMGLSRRQWVLSLLLNVVLGAFFTLIMLSEADVSGINLPVFAQATFVLLVGTLFELFLYYGFIHIRLERAFGTIPAIVLTAAIYVLWHAGTQLPHEPDLLWGVVKLFFVGVLYQSVFSITRNLLVIWPFFAGAGVLLDHMVNLDAMAAVSHQSPWAVVTVMLMATAGIVFTMVMRRQGARDVCLPKSGDSVT